MTTDASSALKRQRRRRICRVIRRTVYCTVGAIFVAFVIGYAAWFRFGWTDLPVSCADWQWGEARYVFGDLRPHAADSLETALAALYGDAAVRRVSPERIQVRPAVIYFNDYDRLYDLSAYLTVRYSDVRANNRTEFDVAQDCRLVQHYLMAGGRAETCDEEWDAFFLQFIRQDTWPLLTRFFHVEQPRATHMGEFLDSTLPVHVEGPRWLAKPMPLSELNCGPTKGHVIFFGSILIAGEVILFVESQWPF